VARTALFEQGGRDALSVIANAQSEQLFAVGNLRFNVTGPGMIEALRSASRVIR
jgi:hypothetical protein